MRVIKWLGIGAAVIVGVIVLAVILVAVFFDANKYKGDIERLTAENLHRPLKLDGDLKLSIFPWIAVQAGPAELGERAGFGEQPFVSVEQVRLSIRLLPLLRGAVEIGDVRLVKPSIHLLTDERGRHNWGDLAGEEGDKATQPESTQSGPVSASVASIDIRDGAVVLDNRQDKSSTAIREFSLRTGAVSSTRPFDLNASFVVEQSNRPPMPVKLNATLTADLEAQRHRLQDFSLETRWMGDAKSANKSGAPVTLRVKSLGLDLHQQTLALEGMELGFGVAKIAGALNGKAILDHPELQGTIQIAPFSPRDLMRDLAIDVPVTRDPNVLKQLSLKADVEAGANSVAMQKVELKLDDSTASGALSVTDLKAFALRLDLNLDRIDFDRYLPPPAKAEATPASSKDAPPATPTPIPVDLLRALNARGDLRIGEAKFSGLKMTKLHVGLNAREGNVELAPTDAGIYGGNYHGSMSIDASGKVPRLAIESHATNVNFAPLFKDLFDTQRVSGHGGANVKVTGNGGDTLAMQKKLNGTLDFNVTDGAFEGTDLWFEIRRARALLHREMPPTQSGPARTPFTSCKGTGVIRDGVMSNNDLDLAMQYLKVGGQGTVDIPKSTLDYRLNVQVLKINDADAAASDLVDAQIPVKVTGTLASPTVRPDIEGLAKARVKQEVEKQKDKLRGRLEDKLKDILKGK